MFRQGCLCHPLEQQRRDHCSTLLAKSWRTFMPRRGLSSCWICSDQPMRSRSPCRSGRPLMVALPRATAAAAASARSQQQSGAARRRAMTAGQHGAGFDEPGSFRRAVRQSGRCGYQGGATVKHFLFSIHQLDVGSNGNTAIGAILSPSRQAAQQTGHMRAIGASGSTHILDRASWRSHWLCRLSRRSVPSRLGRSGEARKRWFCLGDSMMC